MVSYTLRPVETFNQYATCECGGNLKSDGSVFFAHPPQYRHVCDRCGNVEMLRHAHPRTIHVERHDGTKGYHVALITMREECEVMASITAQRGGIIRYDRKNGAVYTADGECTFVIIAEAYLTYMERMRGRMIKTITVTDAVKEKIGEKAYSDAMAMLEMRKMDV